MNGNCTHVLWTGGWDSTFRLLQLLLLHRVPVVPHYLEDPARPSTQIERATMAHIEDCLRATHPHVRELLQPLRVAAVADIARDEEIERALRRIRARSYIGDQYAWLPAFCKQRALDGLELGVHRDDKVQALLRGFAVPFAHPARTAVRVLRAVRVHDRRGPRASRARLAAGDVVFLAQARAADPGQVAAIARLAARRVEQGVTQAHTGK